MSKPTRNDVRDKARERVQYFSAVLAIDKDASVRKGTMVHLDPDVPTSSGWWVDCKVFVSEDDFNDGE
jgi:hypothetical protein